MKIKSMVKFVESCI